MSTLPEEKKLYPSEEARLVARILKFPLQDHPIIPSPTEEQRLKMIERVGVQETMRMFLHREQRIRAEQDDPYRYGTELPAWPDADHILNRHNEILILGGNRASKTEYAAKRIAQAFVGQDVNGNMPDWLKEKAKKRGLNIWCLHTTHMTSVSMQQNVFHKYLPKELKEAKRSHQIQVAWTQKNGFSDNTAVYNKNQIWFLNYSQDIKVVEGGEVDFVWCDELVPADWLETLRYRLVTRNGKLIVTFTPILGYTQVVKEFISTSKINTWKESELLPNNNVLGVPKGHMPYTAESVYG
jgi:phage terminase large subunit-like protein